MADLGMPVLPLRDVVVYPHTVIPLFVGRRASVKALESAMGDAKQILLIAQKKPETDKPGDTDLYQTGTIANILQLLKLPDGTLKVLVEGSQRGEIVEMLEEVPFFLAKVKPLIPSDLSQRETEVLKRTLLSQFEQYLKLNKKMPPEILQSLENIHDLGRLADTIASHMSLRIKDKQTLLESVEYEQRIETLMKMIEEEIELLEVENRIRGNIKKQADKTHREFFLQEQLKAIQKELGQETDNDSEGLRNKIEAAGMPKEAKDKAFAELKKLQAMPPMSAEATVCRNYIEWMVNVPWKQTSSLKKDLFKAEEVLEEDHFGLEKIKERILEYLAVGQRVKKLKGPILCLVGPPGVGKTSLGRSIARATGRQYVRLSLGGVRDEAEIRGHRRTYVGAMPGKILQKLAKVKVKNPLFMLDEVDKMAMDFRGDPASALLEVLDPEQNSTFNDHFLEVDYDLSDVMFVATANSLKIPLPLLDRMEVIQLSGYTEDEKLHIAEQYLIPKQIERNGLKDGEFSLSKDALLVLIRQYTREAGVRNLDREISTLCRKVVKKLLEDKAIKVVHIESNNLEDYLGVEKYSFGQAEKTDQIGQVSGLAWTEVGGEMLTIEARAVPGKGKTICTGKLGDVMQESIQAAMTVVRSRTEQFGIEQDFQEKNDIHVHVPEGATPKDGPSAGIGMCVAIVSALTNRAVRKEVAMTGEITLRGEVLPIGGLKEKLLAARRAGIEKVIIPKENERHLKEISENVYQELKIYPVQSIDEVFAIALCENPLKSS